MLQLVWATCFVFKLFFAVTLNDRDATRLQAVNDFFKQFGAFIGCGKLKKDACHQIVMAGLPVKRLPRAAAQIHVDFVSFCQDMRFSDGRC